uniref:Luciferin 4-monooxygenase n=1 Tax=Heliothis virescens TaxID=7102 RepID=A0A2A4K2X8_HELVI
MVAKNLFTVKRTLNTVKQSSKYASVVIRKHSVWTQDRVITSPYKSIEIPNFTLYEYVWHNLDKWPERTASVCAVTGRGYTYEQAFKLSNRFGANLRTKFKIRDGDTVAVMLPNIPDYPLVALGILEAGGVITSINPIYTAHEIQRQLKMSASKMVVTLPEAVPTIKEALNLAKLNIPIVVVKTNGDPAPEGTALFNELSEDIHADKSCLKKVRRNTNDVCFLPYSSGTTGLPKGVELSHRNIIANCQQINEPLIRLHHDTTATHQDVIMGVLPFFHIYAATVLMFHKLSVGAKLVALSKFSPESFLNTIEKQKTNVLMVAPPLILMMGSHPAATAKTFRHVEFVCNGAAPLAASDVERFLSRCERDIEFRQGYGLTETSPTVSLSPLGSKRYEATGPPIPNTELRIVDKDLKNLGPNETGEILIRGPQVMRGYRENPQANNEVFTADGWFRTGDLGVADVDGTLTIADRLKELIKVKGFQVPPAELESVLREHPSVDDAAVIGIPHQTKGESPKAFVVLKNGHKCSQHDLSKFVNEKVAAYKHVDDISFIDKVPKSAAGKILRRVLKEQYC